MECHMGSKERTANGAKKLLLELTVLSRNKYRYALYICVCLSVEIMDSMDMDVFPFRELNPKLNCSTVKMTFDLVELHLVIENRFF